MEKEHQTLKDENATLKGQVKSFGDIFEKLPLSKRNRSPSSRAPTPDPKRQKPLDALSRLQLQYPGATMPGYVDLSAPAPSPTKGSAGGEENPPPLEGAGGEENPPPLESAESDKNPPPVQQPDQTEGGGKPAPTAPEEGQVEETADDANHFVDKEGEEPPSHLFQKGGQLYQEHSTAKLPDASFLDINCVFNYSLTTLPKGELTKCPKYLTNKSPYLTQKARNAKFTFIQSQRALHDRICQKISDHITGC